MGRGPTRDRDPEQLENAASAVTEKALNHALDVAESSDAVIPFTQRMASNDPIAAKARKPALSIEDAERFASQIRPSWELLGPDAAAAGFGQDDAPGVAAPSAGSAIRAPDTIIEGVPTIAVAGSDESVPIDTSWDDEPAAPKPAEAAKPEPIAAAAEAEAPPIEAKVIASIGIPSAAEVPVAELPLPPQVGHPMVPTPGAPIAPVPAAKTKLGVGGTSGERDAMPAKPKPTRAPASSRAPASARSAAAPAAGKSSVSKSLPDTGSRAAYVPAAGEAEDDIAIPISGAPKGLLLKIGGGVAALAVIAIAIKIFSGSSPPAPVKPAIPTATAAAVTAPPPLDPALAEPPKATAAAAATTAAPAPTVAATTAPTAKEKPIVAKVEPPPPPTATTAKKVAAPPPTGGGTPPAPTAKKKGGGIIRETPF
jgi:hypothetical protein